MVGITSAGIGSGLDISGIIDQLVSAEGAVTQNRLDRREFGIQAELSALGTVRSAFSEFQSSLSGLSDIEQFRSRVVTNTDNTLFTATADNNSQPGSYQVEVGQLAQAHKLSSASFAEPDTSIGSGSITFQFGTYDSGGNTFTPNADKSIGVVTIDSGATSLEGIRDAVNAADIGVTATLLNDGTGTRIIFASGDTGAANSLKITVSDNDGNDLDNAGLSQIAYDPTATIGSGQNLTETVAALDSELTVDGISISNDSNRVTDVIQGVTLNLRKAEVGETSTVTVRFDSSGSAAKVGNFVDAYNSLISSLNDITSFDVDSGNADVLFGDSTVRLARSGIRRIINETIDNVTSDYRALSDIGITTRTDGTLSLDNTRLNEALNDNFDDIGRLFASSGKATDADISFASAGVNTAEGGYSINISQLATQGTFVGSAAANTTITQGVNDTLNIEIDDQTATIVLSAGTYTASSLANEIQSRINGLTTFENNDVSVTVTENSGVLTITSDKYGEESIANITGGNGLTDLFGAGATSTDGVDVAGTIGGVAATGDGRFLTGTGDLAGLRIEVAGETTGNRGTISYARGIAGLLDSYLSSLLEGESVFNERTDSLNRQIDTINDDREVLARRLETIRSRLVKQFTGLDTLLAQLNQTSDFLSRQLSNLPGVSRPSNGDS